MRRRAVLLAPLILLIAACAPTGDPDWSPPGWTAGGIDVEVVDPPAFVDLGASPELAASLTALRLRNDATGLQARFALLPSIETSQAFNDRILGFVREAIATQSSARGIAYAPAAGAGLADRTCVPGSTRLPAGELLQDSAIGPPGADGLSVVCDIVWASGPFLAQRVRAVVGAADAVASDTSLSLFVDTTTGETASPSALWAEGAAEELRMDVIEALWRDAGALTLGEPSAADEDARSVIAAALESTVPDGLGGLVFTVPAGFDAQALAELGVAATTEPMRIGVPAEVASTLVSPLGRRVLESAGRPYAGPAALSPGAERVDCALVPCVAVTYDDGPTGLTGRLLDTLAELHAPATFYMLGSSAAARPDTVRRVAREGHEIGNHTWSHPQLPRVDDAGVADQLSRTRGLLRSLSGQAVGSFRPPYGEYSTRVLEIAGQPAILWNVDTRDWAGPSDDALRSTAIDGARPGGIILFHDTHERSVRVAPEVIRGLRDRGFTLVTITQLFGGQLPASGAWRQAS